MAQDVIALAQKTGWGERYVFWELPYWRLLHYQHVLMRQQDVWTIPPGSDEPAVSPDDQLAMLESGWLPATPDPKGGPE